MNKEEAHESIIKANSELFSLTPSAIVTLFEIDATDLAFNAGNIGQDTLVSGGMIFRFHNNIKFGVTSVYWRGNEYFAAPISAEGFEISAKGTLPVPVLSITSDDEGVNALSVLKSKIRQLDDLVGAKVTRIRTFAKYLDEKNFIGVQKPQGFSPDPNVELPRDTYYIDHKAQEDKNTISFNLSSIFDVQGISLPQEIVSASRCRFQYRGCGCLYEYKANRVPAIHGEYWESTLPESAPPVANVHDEKIVDILNIPSIVVRGEWQFKSSYNKGEAVYVKKYSIDSNGQEKDGIKYYFVSKIDNNTSAPPSSSWIEDTCSLSIAGCRLRWKNISLGFTDNNDNPIVGVLPYGGFPAVNKSR